MKVLVTGANGFLGRAVVAAAAARGHDVVALIRPKPAMRESSFPKGVRVLPGDLRQTSTWASSLGGVEAVIHCAAGTSGDLASQLANTIVATENLLRMLPPQVSRFVMVSSFSVYDYGARRVTPLIDEETPLERNGLRRDAYTQTKLQQERMVRKVCTERKLALTVVRPGLIYGPVQMWSFGSAASLGGLDLVVAPLGRMPLVHVANCAEALVLSMERPEHHELIVNLVDDEQPRRWAFHRKACRAGLASGIGIPVPYFVIRCLGLLALAASRIAFAGQAKLPELLDLPRQQARWRPMRYTNRRACEALGWSPRLGIADAITQLQASRHVSR